MSAEQKNIKVVVRVRPYNRRELEQNQRSIIKVMDNTTLLFDPDEDDDEFFYQGVKINYRDVTKRIKKKLSMEFDRVFDVDATNQELFEECTRPIVDSVMNGYNCSVFVYGATGAGKTFTMLGSEDCYGITYLTMQDLFRKIDSLSDTRKFDIGVSYLEVYNEQVMNLLTKSGPLKLREDANGVVVSGLVLKPIHSADELLHLLCLGNNNRTQHPTDANAESSRSHAIFQVHIRMTDKKTGQKRTVKLSMIDLAGSERAASTRGIGLRFKEGASINKSLLALGNCINKLADGLKHIPYRDSNLTRILKDSLGGNCQTLMVANVSMSSITYEDTYNTLKYASRAKKIRTTLRQNIMKSNMPKDFYVKKVNDQLSEIERYKEMVKNLEAKLESIAAKEQSQAPMYDESELQNWYKKIDAVYSMLIQSQEYFFGLQSKEKVLKFRAKLKEDAEDCRKILTLDEVNVQEDILHFKASIDRFQKQILKQEDDLKGWRQKLKETYKEVAKLKKEVSGAKCYNILKMYLEKKESEVLCSKNDIRANHIAKINSFYLINSENLYKSLNIACKLIQRNYLLLRSQRAVDKEHTDMLEKLQRLMNGHGIKFKGEDKENDEEIDFSLDPGIEIQVNGKRPLSNVEDISALPLRYNKRLQISHDIDLDLDLIENEHVDESAFKKPYIQLNSLHRNNGQLTQAMNETHILTTDDECNLTYNSSITSTPSICQPNSMDKPKKAEFISQILSDQNIRTNNNTALIKNALMKSNITRENVLKTVNAGIQKDNKRHSPNRIQKSPRTGNIISRTIGTTSNLLKRQKTKTGPGNGEPIVRNNRAATMRFKK